MPNKCGFCHEYTPNYCGYCKNYIFDMCFKFKKQVHINNVGCEHYSPCVERQIEILKEQKRG